MKRAQITPEHVRSLVHYEPMTGIFTRKTDGIRRFAVQKVGHIMGYNVGDTGYVHLSISSVKFAAARVAFAIMTGSWPKDQMDHIDRNPSNNKWENLREATPLFNQQNRSVEPRNTTGITGVYWLKDGWRSKARFNNKIYYFGPFDTAEEADLFYRAFKKACFEIMKEHEK